MLWKSLLLATWICTCKSFKGLVASQLFDTKNFCFKLLGVTIWCTRFWNTLYTLAISHFFNFHCLFMVPAGAVGTHSSIPVRLHTHTRLHWHATADGKESFLICWWQLNAYHLDVVCKFSLRLCCLPAYSRNPVELAILPSCRLEHEDVDCIIVEMRSLHLNKNCVRSGAWVHTLEI